MQDPDHKPILVTGGTGFLARHLILQLLRQGAVVRTTVRSHAGGERLKTLLAAEGVETTGLHTVVADLLDPSGWPRALDGVDAVLHVAAPMQGKDVIAASVEGTRTVFEASDRAGVRRLVMTSSGLAAMGTSTGLITEADWTDPDARGTTSYIRAKTLAERLAWELARRYQLELTTILPGAILGPRLGDDRPGWLALVGDMLAGKLRALPPVSLQMVDVRDLAALHIKALAEPSAYGQRYIAMGERYSFRDVALVLQQELGDAAVHVRLAEMPAWLLRLAGLFDEQARGAAALLGARAQFSAAKALRELDWQPRPVRQSIVDTGRSLL